MNAIRVLEHLKWRQLAPPVPIKILYLAIKTPTGQKMNLKLVHNISFPSSCSELVLSEKYTL